MGSQLSLMIPPPARGSNLSDGDRKYLQTLQRQLPLETVDTSAGSYAENAPPAGVNSQSGETNQNQEITYLKTSADANVFTLNGVVGGPYTLTDQLSFLKIKSNGTSWYVSAKSAAAPAAPLVLRTNGALNGSQTLQNLVAGAGVTLTDDGVGDVTVASTVVPATVVPLADSGAGAVGVSPKYARQDHVHPASGGAAGSLAGTCTLFATQGGLQALDLSTEGVLDWFATINSVSGAAGGSQPCKGGSALSGLLRKTFVLIGFGANFGPNGGAGLTMHSDAVDSAGNALGANANFEAIGSGNNPMLNYGFEIEAPASSASVRNLNLYVAAINGNNGNSVTFKAIGRLSDDSAAGVDLTQVQVDTNQAIVNIYKVNFQFQSTVAGARLRVQCIVTGVTGTPQFVTFGLQCATLF